MLIKERLTRFKNKVYVSKHGIWCDGLLEHRHRNVLAILNSEEEGRRLLMMSHNIVTDAGDTYYAQKAVGETVTNAFTSLYLSSVNWDASHPAKGSLSANIASMIAGSEKAVSATYPKTNDGDADNTGAGADIVSWLFSYAKADFNDADIDAGAISVASVPAWGSGTNVLLAAFDFTAFAKTANDTLKIFVNHQMNGI